MPTNKVSDLRIAITVVPKSVQWPGRGSSIVWSKAHDCVDALRALVRRADIACSEAEEDSELSAGAIAHKRSKLCEQALHKLANFRPFEIAQEALSENIHALERLTAPDDEQSQMHQIMTKVLADLREGVEATRRMVLDRCKTRESVSV